MPFTTGSASDIDALINTVLKDFAVTTNGWTLNEDSWPDYLGMSKDTCFVNMRRRGSAVSTPTGDNTFNDVYGNPTTDNRLRSHLSTSYSAAGATPTARYTSQPDSLVSSTGDTDVVEVNDLTGPFVSYHLYSGGATDPDYIYMVVETRAGFFMHFAFGVIDTLAATLSPTPTFLMGTFYLWWADSTTDTVRSDRFWSDASHLYFLSGDNTQIYTGGAGLNQTIKENFEILELYRRLNASDIESPFSSVTGYNNFATVIPALGQNPLNGVTPLVPLPIMVDLDTDADVYFPLGTVPNMRLCSMQGRQPGEIITFGGDEWQLWPFRRQRDDNGTVPLAETRTSPPYENTSSQAGVAYKRVA